MRFFKILMLVALSALLAACSPQASVQVSKGALLIQQDFSPEALSQPAYAAWDEFSFIGTPINFGMVDGSYAVTALGEGYVWALNHQAHSNVIIEVTVQLVGDSSGSGAQGIMCRAHPNPSNNGIAYYFLIRGDGYWGIRQGESNERITPLINWTASSAIKQNEANRLRVACVDDYLALWINEQFMGEVRHDWLKEGYLGFTVNAGENSQLLTRFDDLSIWEASIQN